jgi:hypothetical protein
MVFTLVLAGCGGSSSDSGVAAGTTASSRTGSWGSGFRCLRHYRHCKTPPATNTAPTIAGLPPTSVNADSPYNFTPTASDAESDALTFNIQNKPAWASFNAATGALSGSPTAANVGSYANIIISVSDGVATTALAPFAISVVQAATGAASLSWTAPTTNSDGTALSNLAGYRIHYGTTTAMTQTAQVTTAGVTTYTLGNLTSGTWYFAVSAYATSGAESTLSNTASKTIP